MFERINLPLLLKDVPVFFRGNNFRFLSLFLIALISQTGYGQDTTAQKTGGDATILEAGKPIERELSSGEKHTYQVNLPANQYAKVIVEQHGIDVVARLLSAGGKIITDTDYDPRREGRETVEFTSKDQSAFTISIWPKQNNALTGRYKIIVEEIHPASDKDYALDEARRLIFEANNLWRASKYTEARPLAEKAFAIREKELGADSVDFASSLVVLANIRSDSGEYEVSEALYFRALAIKEKALGKEDISLSAILNNLGLLYNLKGNYVAAETAFRRALEIREKNLDPNHLLIANTVNNLAGLNRLKGDEVKAAEYYRRALEIREKALPPDHPDVATSLSNLANLYSDVATAVPLYRRALAIREKALGVNDPNVAETLYNMAALFIENNDPVNAEPLGKRALEIYEKSLGPEHPTTSYALNLIAIIYANKGDYAQAETLYQKAIAIKEKTQAYNHPDLGGVYLNLANIYALRNEIERAVSMQARANNILEFNVGLNLTVGSEKQKFDYLKTLDSYINTTLSLNFQYAPDSESAENLGAEIVLRRKGRVLDAMADNIGALRRRFNEQDRVLLDNLNNVSNQISELISNGPGNESIDEYQAKIKKLSEERDKVEDSISRRAAGFYEKTRPVTISDIKPLIPQTAALVEFSVYNSISKTTANLSKPQTEPHYAVYVLHNQGRVGGVDLGAAKQIDESINAFRQALRDPKRADVKQLAGVLYKKIIQPIRVLLGDSSQILVSPDGELSLVPFEALVDDKGQYLIENYAISYLTSGRDLLRMKTTRESQSNPLLVVDPAFSLPVSDQTAKSVKTALPVRRNIFQDSATTESLSEAYFAPLSGTVQEGRSIQSIFPESKLLTGAGATKSALKQVNAPRILHIATHGFFLQNTRANASGVATPGLKTIGKIENPLLRSGLALAGANRRNITDSGDDGMLTALEASDLNLWGTKLVVLSACDTGVGEIKNGEGVYGLRRAFVLAGAESLVMSLWPISDYVTRELMTNYYKNLRQGMGRGAALRQVQLDMLKKNGRQHPFYWAAFIQSGEWASLDGKR